MGKKSIWWLSMLIALLAFVASSYGIFSSKGGGKYSFTSLSGEIISIYGQGLYKNDSVSMASQAIAQDYVTLLIGIPLLLVSLFLVKKEFFKGKLLLTGTLGYFLYTYTSYSFLSMYNALFLVYVILMSASFFGFTLSLMAFDQQKIATYFSESLPVKSIGGFLLATSILFAFMWLAKIIPALVNGGPPAGLEHYTTLVIQAMDIGFVIPAGLLSGILLLRKIPFGYLLATVLLIKDMTLVTALTVMIILQRAAGIQVNAMVILLVLLVNFLVIYFVILVMKNINEPGRSGEK